MKRQKHERTALMCATDILARQENSENRLRQKLTQRGYPEEEIENALDKLKERNYLNDERACARQFEILYDGSASIRQITAKLINRGFELALIENCIPDNSDEYEQAAALKVLKVKFKNPADNQKMWQHLAAKGFEFDAMTFAIEKFNDEFE